MINNLRKIGLFYILLAIVACKNEKIELPKIIEQTKVLFIPLEPLYFETKGNDWEAILYSIIQPIKLKVIYNDNGFFLVQEKKKGIIEGPGTLVLKNNDQHFIYHFNLINKRISQDTEVDLRSPKTVNPDSSLYHQKLVYKIDSWQNIVPLNSLTTLFKEEVMLLPSLTGTYRAQENIPLSSYYVQSGSCNYIPIKAESNIEKKQFIIKAGPLNDAFGNMISDGTLVSFISFNGKYIRQIETTSKVGFATIQIDGSSEKNIYAKIDNTISEKLNLKRLK